MDHQLYEYCLKALKSRIGRVILLFCISAIVITTVIRMIRIPFNAVTTMLVTQSNELSALGMSSGLSIIEKDVFIKQQETILTSNRVYKRILQAPETGVKMSSFKSNSLYRAISRSIKRVLFGQEYVSTLQSLADDNFSNFKNNISFQGNPESSSFTISYSHTDPELAIAVCAELTKALINVNKMFQKNKNKEALTFLEKKIADLQETQSTYSENIAEFIKNKKFANNSAMIENRYTAYLGAQQQYIEKKAYLSQVIILKDDSEKYLSSLQKIYAEKLTSSRSKEINQLFIKIELQERQLKALKIRSTSEYQTALKKISNYKKDLKQSIVLKQQILTNEAILGLVLDSEKKVKDLESEVLIARQQLKLAQAEQSRLSADIEKIPSLQADLEKMINVQENLSKTLRTLEERHLELMVKQDSEITNLVTLEAPSVQSTFKTSKLRILVAGLLAALILMAMLTVFIELLKGTILDSNQLKHNTVVYLGACPHLEFNEASKGLWLNEDITILAQEFRRVSFNPKAPKAVGQVSTFVSAEAAAGKSMTCISMAAGLARRKSRILLIDGDYRASGRESLSLLANHVLDNKEILVLDDLCARPHLITQQQSSDKITMAKVFNQDELEIDPHIYFTDLLPKKINLLATYFDNILIDMPPLFFADTLEAIKIADNTILCLREGSDTMNSFTSSVSMIDKHRSEDAKIFAIITDSKMNINSAKNSYYYYHRRRGAA